MASAPSASRKSRCIMPLESFRSRKSPIDSFDQARFLDFDDRHRRYQMISRMRSTMLRRNGGGGRGMPADSPTRQKLLKRRKASPLVESKMGAVVWEQIDSRRDDHPRSQFR